MPELDLNLSTYEQSQRINPPKDEATLISTHVGDPRFSSKTPGGVHVAGNQASPGRPGVPLVPDA